MRRTDYALELSIPALILWHLRVVPHTKVEESFNLQATHDILKYGYQVSPSYDHFEFPGAVDRTFVGAAALATVSTPIIALLGEQWSQFVVRAVLGLFNAFALIFYKRCLGKAYGNGVARWYAALQASQFHVIYYASRTLPNSFAFGLVTMATGLFLPSPPSPGALQSKDKTARRQQIGISLLVFAGVVFRAEIALLLVPQFLLWFCMAEIAPETFLTTSITAAIASLAISVPIDSYYWQKLVWPELSSLIFNVYHGKSSQWGTSPWYTYFINMMPKMLLNPLSSAFNLFANFYEPLQDTYTRVAMPSWIFICLYSFQAHKEARFIIYAVPPMTAAAALAANWIWTRRSKTIAYRVGSTIALASIPLSFLAAMAMLGISSLSYPGGYALPLLNGHLIEANVTGPVRVHVDVLSCMTGVTLFEMEHPTPPMSFNMANGLGQKIDLDDSDKIQVQYSKEEDPAKLLDPKYWASIDYALVENPALLIGNWELVDTIYGYEKMELLRPDTGLLDVSKIEIIDAIDSIFRPKVVDGEEAWALHPLVEELGPEGILKEGIRRLVTRGWWYGPKMAAKIHLLKRVSPAEGYEARAYI